MVKVSDYVFQYLESIGVGTVFTLTGGGIMHLVDSLGRSGIGYACCHHEQAAAIAAQAYGMYNGKLGVCLVTTGPGGTNALTGTAAAYMDSTPVLYISGQVKRPDFASLRGVRQFGAQENDIAAMARPVTKYAVLVMEPEDIAYELEKCVYLASHGRKGPVWMDIPLDVQDAMVDGGSLRHYAPEADSPAGEAAAGAVDGRTAGAGGAAGISDGMATGTGSAVSGMAQVGSPADGRTAGTGSMGEAPVSLRQHARQAVQMFREAERPVLLVGHGMVASGAQELVRRFVGRTGIPVLATWRALGFMGREEPGFFGSPGLQAPRYSNLILQHADALLVLGSRMDNMITAFNEAHFAFRAKKMVVDIDGNEIQKLAMAQVTPVVADARAFMEALVQEVEEAGGGAGQGLMPDYSLWTEKCRKLKERFPVLAERQDKEEGVSLYRVTEEISKHATAQDTIAISSTSRCNTAGHIAFGHKRGQKTISSMGMGSMGFALPSAVGAYYASGKRRVVMVEGDGSLQLNIQELQAVAAGHMDIKMFIFNNNGYAAITTMQDRNFGGFYVGSNKWSGLSMPDLGKIAGAYGIPYVKIAGEGDIQSRVEEAMGMEGPVLCDIQGSLWFDEIPKCISHVDAATGKRVSAYLENPYPFLLEEEMGEIEGWLLG